MEYNDIRRKSRQIKIGSVTIGGGSPIAVQSMTNTKGYQDTYEQMRALEMAGCDIIRMAVPDTETAEILYKLKCSDIKMPIVADIHFDYRLAIEAAEAGADKIRINPGNIGLSEHIKAVVDECRKNNIPIRVGVNSGSLAKEQKDKFGEASAEALAESALSNVRLLEKYDFDNIVVAVKSSSPYKMTKANEIIAAACEYPLHLGVTEAGTEDMGAIKGAIGIGGLLCRGIGDTIRVSLTASPLEEVACAKKILIAAGFYSKPAIEVVSCPTCGRTKIDIISIANEFEKKARSVTPSRKIKVAIMGCVVNGPGEASDADIGIAGGDGEALLFKKGKIVGKISEERIIDTLINEVKEL